MLAPDAFGVERRRQRLALSPLASSPAASSALILRDLRMGRTEQWQPFGERPRRGRHGCARRRRPPPRCVPGRTRRPRSRCGCRLPPRLQGCSAASVARRDLTEPEPTDRQHLPYFRDVGAVLAVAGFADGARAFELDDRLAIPADVRQRVAEAAEEEAQVAVVLAQQAFPRSHGAAKQADRFVVIADIRIAIAEVVEGGRRVPECDGPRRRS